MNTLATTIVVTAACFIVAVSIYKCIVAVTYVLMLFFHHLGARTRYDSKNLSMLSLYSKLEHT